VTDTRWEAAEQFRPTADNLPVLMWIADTDKLCTWFNTTWLNFVGRTMEQELGNGWAEGVHAEDFERALETYVTSFDARQPFRMEYRLRRYDGEYHWLLDEGRPLYTENGDFAGYIGCCLVVSEQKRTEEKLSVLNDSLVQANEQLAQSLTRERRIAHTLQSAFLPPFLPKVGGIEFQAVYRPAESDAQVGGDWYDAFLLGDGRIALSIGDIFGHGLEAAGEMIRLRETLRALAGFINEDPAAILQSADRAFQASHPGAIASAVFAIYDPSTRRLRTANAGHPQPALVHNGKATQLPPGDVLLGVSPDSAFRVHETQLEPGDSFVLYTDGLVESERDLFAGEQRLLQRLSDGPIDAEDLVKKLTAKGQQDDVAVLVFSLIATTAQPSWRFQADDANSAGHARNAFVAHLRQRSLDPDVVEAAMLVFGELVANVVRHAPGPIEVELNVDDSDLLLYVRDRGPAFSPGKPSLPADVMSEGGRGLYLVRMHASQPTVTTRFGGGNEVCVRMNVPLPATARE
jgi:PAS domain S-box-containing protein